MKLTREGKTRPLVSLTSYSTGSGDAPSGQVIVSTGSNGGTSWGSNVSHIYSNGSNHLLGPFVNFASGTNITFAVASNTLTISGAAGGDGADDRTYNVEDYGAVHDGTTDDTAAIQAAIDAWESGGRTGIVYFPPDTDGTHPVYAIKGALQDTSTFNSQLKIPQGSSGSLRFLGPATLRSDWAGTISGNPAVISAGLHDSLTINQVFVRFDSIRIEVPVNPKLTAIDMTKAATCRWSSLSIAPITSPTSLPTNTNAIGLDLPWGLNDQNSGGQEVYIDGFYTGIRPSEQMVADAVYLTKCTRAVEMRGAVGPPEYLAHSANIQRLNVWFCERGIVFTGDVRYINVTLMDVEHDDPDFVTVYDIDDASDYGRGFIGWHTTDYDTGEPVDQLLINGGDGLSLFGGFAKRWRLANVVEIPVGTDPSTNPPSGFSLYAASATGKPTTRSSAGTVTTIMREGDTAGGDLSGTYPNPTVVDDSHSHTSATVPSGGNGAILLESGHAVPFTFDEILQESDGSDFLYASA